jgi:hypothetical protein
MSSSGTEPVRACAQNVVVTDTALNVELADGRSVAVPLEWYPRLATAAERERLNWSLIGDGEGIHWPDLDEDISVASLLAGTRSGESQTSLKRWLESRAGSSG